MLPTEPPKKASLVGSILGAAAAFAAKQGLTYVTGRLHGVDGGDDAFERYELPPAARRPYVE